MKNKSILIILCLVIAFLSSALIMCLLPYRNDIVNRVVSIINPIEYFSVETPDSLVIESMLSYSYENHKSVMIRDEHRGLPKDIKSYFKPERLSYITNHYNEAYYYVGLSYYALSQNNEKLDQFLMSKADEFLDSRTDSLAYDIYVIDQYPIGLFYINMYKLTGNTRYLNVVKILYSMLMERTDENGNITYLADTPIHYSDELGMYVPFLMEYNALTGDKRAVEIVKHNVDYYKEFGTDVNSGLPFHGFNSITKQKLGSANWGRGIGWYALAMSYCPPSIFEDKMFDTTMSQIDYTQFPGGGNSHFDSSTALLFEIYKASRSQEDVSIDFIKPYIRNTGIVDFFSGDTFDFNDYSHLFGCSELGNGLVLMLVGRFQKRNSVHKQTNQRTYFN